MSAAGEAGARGVAGEGEAVAPSGLAVAGGGADAVAPGSGELALGNSDGTVSGGAMAESVVVVVVVNEVVVLVAAGSERSPIQAASVAAAAIMMTRGIRTSSRHGTASPVPMRRATSQRDQRCAAALVDGGLRGGATPNRRGVSAPP